MTDEDKSAAIILWGNISQRVAALAASVSAVVAMLVLVRPEHQTPIVHVENRISPSNVNVTPKIEINVDNTRPARLPSNISPVSGIGTDQPSKTEADGNRLREQKVGPSRLVAPGILRYTVDSSDELRATAELYGEMVVKVPAGTTVIAVPNEPMIDGYILVQTADGSQGYILLDNLIAQQNLIGELQ